MSIDKIFVIKKYLEKCLTRDDVQEKIINAFRKLKKVEMNLEILQTTGIGKTVNSFRKFDPPVGEKAKQLVTQWKQLLDLKKTEKHSNSSYKPITNGINSDDVVESCEYGEYGDSNSHESDYGEYDEGESRTHDSSPRLTEPVNHLNSTHSKKRKYHQLSDDEEANSYEECLNNNMVLQSSETTRHEGNKSHSDSHDKAKSKHKSHKKHRHKEPSRTEKQSSSKSTVSKNKTCRNSELLKEKKQNIQPLIEIAKPPKEIKLSTSDIIASAPNLTTNYKPLPQIDLEQSAKHKASLYDVGTKRHTRTQVYSGKKGTFYLTSVPTLYNACLRCLKDNVDSLAYVGGVPYSILKPVLEVCTANQLYYLEDVNMQFIGETEELWKIHAKKEFRNSTPDEFESWREMYLRLHDERESRLKSLAANISKTVKTASTGVRKAQLAYVSSSAKAPRSIRKKQIINGTAGPVRDLDPLARLSSHGGGTGEKQIPRAPILRDPNPPAPPTKHRTKRAPMMAKTMKLMKAFRR